MRRILTLLLFTTICSGAQGQRLNPGDYIYPIRGVAGLYSANFGEMRPGHFHGGIDIKTDGGEGKPLVAVADGYVSRVSVSPSGYGRAIYLTLGNGTTAVYGHLQRFRGDIEKQVRDERCRRRANSVDLWFGPDAWPVAQGDTIGFSGNSGSSMGPHLHFELRDTPTQRLYNVVREGVVRPDDDLPPRIMRIHTTAVYGHLQRFRGDIEKQVRDERCRRRANSVDLWFGPDAWPVAQGDTIGFSGNSGSSMGPHLHFELRDTPTQRLYNVVREGVVRPDDDLPPRIMRIHYIEVDSVQGVPVHGSPESYAVVREAEGRYRLTREEPVGTGRKGYFVLEASDRRNGVHNTFGLWRASMSVDGDPRFEYRMNGFTHDLSRCCDAVSHYPMQLTSRNEVIRLAQLAESPDCFYPVMRERGLVRTAEGEKRRIRIEAEDDCGNRSQLEFDILGRTETLRTEADSTAVVLRPEKAALVRAGRDLTARIPAGAVYEPIFCRPEQRQAPASDSTAAILSPAYRILGAETPLRRPMTVSVHAFVPDDMQSRTVLATRTAKGRIACIGGRYADGAVTATTRTTGDIFVAADIIPPRIRPLFSEGADLGGARSIRFRVSDNFSGIASCTLLIDGRWVPCDRFPMQGTLVHAFDLPAAKKRRSVQLTVTDRCGNTARWEGTFWR